jgi:hypothetical protein
MNNNELRDFFAGMAVVGLLPYMSMSGSETIPEYAKMAYALSDAMLEAREKERRHDD